MGGRSDAVSRGPGEASEEPKWIKTTLHCWGRGHPLPEPHPHRGDHREVVPNTGGCHPLRKSFPTFPRATRHMHVAKAPLTQESLMPRSSGVEDTRRRVPCPVSLSHGRGPLCRCLAGSVSLRTGLVPTGPWAPPSSPGWADNMKLYQVPR